MEKIKVIKSHPVYINLLLFSFMGILLVALQLSLQSNTSLFTKSFILNLLVNKSAISLTFLTLLIAQFFNKKYVHLLFRFHVTVVTFSVFQSLVLDFNKVILILMCGFITIAYIFDQLIKSVTKMACYHSPFDFDSLWDPSISCPKIVLQQGEKNISGVCINWDDGGVLVKILDANVMESVNYRHVLEVSYVEQGQTIQVEGQIVSFSHNYRILGIIIIKQSKKNPISWSELLEIWSDRGLDPEWVR